MSQISNLTVVVERDRLREEAAPIVVLVLKELAADEGQHDDLPTAESPRRTSLNWKTRPTERPPLWIKACRSKGEQIKTAASACGDGLWNGAGHLMRVRGWSEEYLEVVPQALRRCGGELWGVDGCDRL